MRIKCRKTNWTIPALLLLAGLIHIPFYCGAEQPSNATIRVLLTYGGHDFEQKAFFEMFDNFPNIEYSLAELPKEADLLKPGLEEDYDVIVRYDMVNSISSERRSAFLALLDKGIGLVALHHNLAAHIDWIEYADVIGGKFLFKHTTIDGEVHAPTGYVHDQEIDVRVVDKEHPITKGVDDFKIHDETYFKYYTSGTVRVLLETDHPDNDPEIAWVSHYGKSPVFYLMLGHDSKAWSKPEYSKLLLNGIRWAGDEVCK